MALSLRTREVVTFSWQSSPPRRVSILDGVQPVEAWALLADASVSLRLGSAEETRRVERWVGFDDSAQRVLLEGDRRWQSW